MQVQTCKIPIEQDEERTILENLYQTLDQRLGHAAEDEEICDAMKITLDEFHQSLDRIKEINLGSFQKIASQTSVTNNDPLIRYIPDTSKTDGSFTLRESEIRQALTRAIEALPELERLITSLYYYEELTVKEIEVVLGINEACIARLHTKAMLRLRSKLTSERRMRLLE